MTSSGFQPESIQPGTPPGPTQSKKGLSKGSKILLGLGIGCGALVILSVIGILIAMFVLGLGIESGHIPDSAALPAGKIPSPIIEKLREMEIIEPEEEVLYFYSSALFSIEEDGNLFTDRRVISYSGGDTGLDVYSATYDEIEELEFLNSESWLDDSSINVYTTDGDWFLLVVSSEGQRDDDFFAKLKRRWERASSGTDPDLK